ncbi:MAG TPA: TRAP transporter substrate-binding protein [Pseudomonadales bacterium]|nr:TRAP transporter substrate-binding protein [Pseudomonadales bacterium]
MGFRWSVIIVMLFAVVSCGGNKQATSQAASAPAEKTVFHWRLVTSWPKNYPGMGMAPERLAKEVDKMSDGRLKISVYGANEIVPAMGVFDAVSLGNVEMGHSASYYWKGKIPAAVFFTTVPFGLTAQEMNGWLYYGGGLKLWDELYAKYNLVPLPGGNTGVQMAGWFNKPINSIDDIKGMKMRIPGLGGEVFERAGGTAVTIPGGEIFTSMQTGVIDATEWVGPYNDLAFGLNQVGKYYYYPGWHEPGPNLEFIINKKAWDSLPPDLQEILTVASEAINADTLDEYVAKNNAALQELKQKGVIIRKLPDDVLIKLSKISDQVVKEVAGDDPLAQKIYQSYVNYKNNVDEYDEISEHAYMNARTMAEHADRGQSKVPE